MAKKVDIANKPNMKVKNLKPLTRAGSGSYVFKSTWAVDASAKQVSNDSRLEGFDIQIILGLYDVRENPKKAKTKKTLVYERRSWWADRKEWEFDLAEFRLKDPHKGYQYKRSVDFYPGPKANNLGIRWMTIKVRCINHKGVGAWASETRKITQPRKPAITKLEQVEATGVINCTVSHNKGQDYAENYNTRVLMNVYDSVTHGYLEDSHKDWTIYHTESSGSNNTINVYQRMSDTYSDYRQVKVEAWTRGLWGPSEHTIQYLQVGWPKQPKIKGVDVAKNVKLKDDTYADTDGKVTVDIETFTHPYDEKQKGIINHHPATGVRLEKLVNVEWRRSEEIPGDAEWEPCGAYDDGLCYSLSSTVAELRSSPGSYTWIRVKSWNTSETMFFRYSDPRLMSEIYIPPETSTTDRASIYSAAVGDDGESAVIRFQWLTDESTGTEISWSDDQNAWMSTKEPETFLVTRSDGTRTSGGRTYNYAILHVADLKEGTTYYFRARRYKDTDDDPIYGPYCKQVDVTPYKSPDAVTLVVPAFVRRGGDAVFSWSFDSEAKQKQWELITGAVDAVTEEVRVIGSDTNVERTRYVIHDEKAVQVLASGTDELTGYTVPWVTIGGDEEGKGSKLIDNDHLFVAVRVDTGGGYVLSDAELVEIADVPIISSVSAETVTAQPLEMTVTCDTQADLSIVVRSLGASGEYAGGDMMQAEGDSIWAVSVSPDWVESEGTYTVTITAPSGLPLIDGCDYLVTCRAVDPSTDLSSEEATCTVEVAYAHKATPPAESIAVEPYDVTDEEGYRTRGALIRLAPPVYNIAEWFSHDLSDAEYWATTDQETYGTAEGDGWLGLDVDGSCTFATNDDGSGTYLVEWHDAEGSFAMSIAGETLDTGDANGSVLVAGGVGEPLVISGTFKGSVRVSLYQGDYDGVYAAPSTPEAAAEDVYDVFRVTPDGPYLVAEDVALDGVVDDPWAPYGETHYYRVRTRTVDGCEEYADYPYELAGKDLRIDWDGRYLELPYDLSVSDQYEKDFEARRHLDGSVDGYWNQGAVRRGSLSTNIIKARDAEKAAALRALGRHAGPCYVRLPDGCAYQADVQLSGIARENKSFAMAVSINATEVALTADYMAVIPTEEG